MANRIPLIVNPSAEQIQELPTGDNLIGIAGATFGNIQIAVTGDNEIDTSQGDLTIDSAGGLVHVTDNFKVDGECDVVGQFECQHAADATSTGSGAIQTAGGISCTKKLFVGDEIKATNDITAFVSDIRLKTNVEPLNNALDKISSLNGFTYKFNETGGSLGFNTEVTYVGVSAQDVAEVLPEAVKPAPVNNKYSTVQYEKLVPLLIEAIKELKAEVEELKTHTH